MPNSPAISPAVTNKVLFNNESSSFSICGFRLYRLLSVFQLTSTAYAAMGLLLFEIPTIYRSVFLRSPSQGLGGSLLTDDTAHLIFINIIVNVVSILYIRLYVNFKYLFRKNVNISIYYFQIIHYNKGKGGE